MLSTGIPHFGSRGCQPPHLSFTCASARRFILKVNITISTSTSQTHSASRNILTLRALSNKYILASVQATMPTLRTFTTFASSLLSQIPLLSPQQPSHQPSTSSLHSSPFYSLPTPNTHANFDHTCPITSPVSCHNSTSFPDSCCFIYPGGQLLQTQFWDTGPSVGPSDSWTLHGLWSVPFTFPTSRFLR